MTITVDPDGLAGDGAALATWQSIESPPGCQPAGADGVSVGVAAQLVAHSASLTALINHAHELRAEGGLVTVGTATSLRSADEAGARVIAGMTSVWGAVPALLGRGVVADPVLPEIPAMPTAATIPGEAQAVALYTGPGAAGLRELANDWQSLAATLDTIGAETSQAAASIGAHWSDSIQQASANAALHGSWWSGLAGRVRALACAAGDAADHYDQAIAATPSPQEFAAARQRLAEVSAANAASHGMLSSQVSAAAAQLAQLQSQASDAAAAYHTAALVTMGSIASSPQPAPPIAAGGGPGAVQPAGGPASAAKTDAGGSAQPASGPGAGAGAATAATAASANTGTDTGMGSLGSMMENLLPAATMLPMMAMAPMSALSGLSGARQPGASTLANQLARRSDDAPLDPDMPGDLGDTTPAASGGGGVEPVSGAAPPVSHPSPSSSSAVSGPAASVANAAGGAATAPAAAADGGGMASCPPMMGASGAGDGGAHRDVRLYPDRRMVARPLPNSEAVFGELPRERRPRVKRVAAAESANEG